MLVVLGITLDLRWFFQFVVTASLIALGLLHLVKNTASKYFEVDSSFDATSASIGGERRRSESSAFGKAMVEAHIEEEGFRCVVCSDNGRMQCSRCKAVRYCSTKCQTTHWNTHRAKCRVNKPSSKKLFGDIALVIENGKAQPLKKIKKVLFPYDEFIDLYNWERPGFPPSGLINCGNSCYANVVLQCLAATKPLVAYLLSRGHQRECRRNDWCFLCELQGHLERASNSLQPFSPINILSRLPNIGGNLGYGRQEDAHEFMRFAIDTMQSVCLGEFGGEKAVHPSSQETTLIQHIFGGQLQSQVICTNCSKVSSQYENMMDLTVEIHGNATSLEECLQQFTDREWLHGDNMYRCDGCNDYVKAWKRLTVWKAPNILTIALKRFQSGRFGKLNKKVNFPETLDLSPYMSEEGDGTDVYKLYAVVVHVDMLNASFFGHYICYTKDFSGNWYRNDDCKISNVGLDEVLSQGAYMLLYSRVSPRPSCLTTPETSDPQKERNKSIPSSKEEEEEAQLGCSDSGTSSSSCEELPIHKSGESKDIDDTNGAVSLTSTLHGVVMEQNPKGGCFLQDVEIVDENEAIGNQQITLVSENGPSESEDLRDVDDSSMPYGGGVDDGVGSSSSSSSTINIDSAEKDDIANGVEFCNGGVVGLEGIASPINSFGGNHHECKA